MDVQIFGEADRGKDGKIKSSYPSWYFTSKVRDLEEDIEDLKRRLETADDFTGEARALVPQMRKELAEKQHQYEKIVSSRPQLSGKQKDELAKFWEEIGNDIRESFFARSDMLKGLVDPYEEAARMVERRIDASGKMELLSKMGIKPVDGKISRNEAAKAWKIAGRLLGENTHVEALRRDKVTGTYHSERRLEELL